MNTNNTYIYIQYLCKCKKLKKNRLQEKTDLKKNKP